MDNSQSPYAQLLASSSLLKVITDHTLRYESPHENLIPELPCFLAAVDQSPCLREQVFHLSAVSLSSWRCGTTSWLTLTGELDLILPPLSSFPGLYSFLPLALICSNDFKRLVHIVRSVLMM